MEPARGFSNLGEGIDQELSGSTERLKYQISLKSSTNEIDSYIEMDINSSAQRNSPHDLGVIDDIGPPIAAASVKKSDSFEIDNLDKFGNLENILQSTTPKKRKSKTPKNTKNRKSNQKNKPVKVDKKTETKPSDPKKPQQFKPRVPSNHHQSQPRVPSHDHQSKPEIEDASQTQPQPQPPKSMEYVKTNPKNIAKLTIKSNNLPMKKSKPQSSDEPKVFQTEPVLSDRSLHLMNLSDLSHLKPTKQEVEFQRELRNRLIDNIGDLKNKNYSAGSETLDKILLDFYKMLYDDRDPIQQSRYETAAFLIDFFQSYTKKLSKNLEDLERQFKDRSNNLDRCNEDNYNLQAEIKNLNAKIEDLNKKLLHQHELVKEAEDNVHTMNLKTKDLEKNFETNIQKYKDLLSEANKQMDLKNLEMIEFCNKIKNLENQLRMRKEDHDKAVQEIQRTRAMVDQSQTQNKTLKEEIQDLRNKIDVLTHEKESLAKKVIEWELQDKNWAALQADLDTHKQINKRLNKELVEFKRQVNLYKIESEALKHEKDGLEEYLRNMKNNMAVIQTSIEDPALSSYLAKKPPAPLPFRANKGSILELIEGTSGNTTPYGQSRAFAKQNKDKFEFDLEQPSSPKTKAPSIFKGGNVRQFHNEDTWRNLGKYKIQDKYQNLNPAGKPSNPTHYKRPTSEENNPHFNSNMAQWESDQENKKELDKELTKFQRAKLFIESDLCRIKIAPTSMGVSYETIQNLW